MTKNLACGLKFIHLYVLKVRRRDEIVGWLS
jgi:hypothetical protein